MRLRCLLAYDGTAFAGWQRQPRGRSVQAEVEAAIERVTGFQARVVGAGRTDAGVHALGQVAHFDTPWLRTVAELRRAVGAVLPDDVALRAMSVAGTGFHARHSAVARRYRYVAVVGRDRRPLERYDVAGIRSAVDVATVAEAAGHLLGWHDFGAFGHPMYRGGSTVRRLEAVLVRSDGRRLVMEFEADAFLRHQVRRMVGLLLDIGHGRVPLAAARENLERSPEAPVPRRAAARGLTLVAVRYPPEDEPWDHPRCEGETGEDLYT